MTSHHATQISAVGMFQYNICTIHQMYMYMYMYTSVYSSPSLLVHMYIVGTEHGKHHHDEKTDGSNVAHLHAITLHWFA